MNMNYIREFWHNYRSEVFFFFGLSAVTVLGHWLSRFVPVDLLENVLLLSLHSINTAVCFIGAWMLFLHSDGLRIRRACGYALAIWGVSDLFFMIQTYFLDQPVLNIGSEALSVYMLFAGNFLGWLLLIYPTETLRPGWLNLKRAIWQLLPLVALCLLDYWLPIDLRWLISLYPVALFVFVLSHIRAYRIWCENNYSTMDHIDVQWIVRYLIMLSVLGGSYVYMMVSDNPCRGLMQNILICFMLVYSIEQILFRRDPWDNLTSTENAAPEEDEAVHPESAQVLEQWMETEKPYVNPEFQLMDLRAVLPMNRTYLSKLINTTYGCSFFEYVNHYRVEEAKRLMEQNPDMRVSEIATHSGFSSPTVFSRVFTRETGVLPSEWRKKLDIS